MKTDPTIDITRRGLDAATKTMLAIAAHAPVADRARFWLIAGHAEEVFEEGPAGPGRALAMVLQASIDAFVALPAADAMKLAAERQGFTPAEFRALIALGVQP